MRWWLGEVANLFGQKRPDDDVFQISLAVALQFDKRGYFGSFFWEANIAGATSLELLLNTTRKSFG